LIDKYGESGWAEIYLNGKPTKWMNYNGKIELETSKKGLNEIVFKHYGYITSKIIIECNQNETNIGKVYLISEKFWLDGPKNGFIDETYESGKTKYKIGIKNWKLNGESKFYNKNGILTQKLIYKKGKLIKIKVRENENLKEIKFELLKNGEILTVPNTV
jgi:antitoxin component YwqK of YwqJK toxin-antitoxin module